MSKEKESDEGGKKETYPGRTVRMWGCRTFFSKISLIGSDSCLSVRGQGGKEGKEEGDVPRTGSTRRRMCSRTPKSEGAASCSCVRGRREPRGFSWE